MADLPGDMPVIEGDYVKLRAWRHSDAATVAAASTDPQIPLTTTVPEVPTDTAIAAFIDRQHSRLTDGIGYSFAIARAANDQAVGLIGLFTGSELEHHRATIGYWLAPQFRQNGYLRTALAQLSSWALTHDNLERLQLLIEPWNEKSWRAAEACQFEREALLHSYEMIDGELKDMYLYARLSH